MKGNRAEGGWIMYRYIGWLEYMQFLSSRHRRRVVITNMSVCARECTHNIFMYKLESEWIKKIIIKTNILIKVFFLLSIFQLYVQKLCLMQLLYVYMYVDKKIKLQLFVYRRWNNLLEWNREHNIHELLIDKNDNNACFVQKK